MRAECLHVRDAIIVGVVQPDGLAGVARGVAEEVVVRHYLHGGLGCGEDGVGEIAGVLQAGHDISFGIRRDSVTNRTYGNMVHAEVEPQNTAEGKCQNGTKEGDPNVEMNAHVFLVKGLSVEELVKLDDPRGKESDFISFG